MRATPPTTPSRLREVGRWGFNLSAGRGSSGEEFAADGPLFVSPFLPEVSFSKTSVSERICLYVRAKKNLGTPPSRNPPRETFLKMRALFLSNLSGTSASSLNFLQLSASLDQTRFEKMRLVQGSATRSFMYEFFFLRTGFSTRRTTCPPRFCLMRFPSSLVGKYLWQRRLN